MQLASTRVIQQHNHEGVKTVELTFFGIIHSRFPSSNLSTSSGEVRNCRLLVPMASLKPSEISAVRYGNCSASLRYSGVRTSGCACSSSAFNLRSISGFWRRWNCMTDSAHAVVSVPAMAIFWDSSRSRSGRFSISGRLLSRISSKTVWLSLPSWWRWTTPWICFQRSWDLDLA